MKPLTVFMFTFLISALGIVGCQSSSVEKTQEDNRPVLERVADDPVLIELQESMLLMVENKRKRPEEMAAYEANYPIAMQGLSGNEPESVIKDAWGNIGMPYGAEFFLLRRKIDQAQNILYEKYPEIAEIDPMELNQFLYGDVLERLKKGDEE